MYKTLLLPNNESLFTSGMKGQKVSGRKEPGQSGTMMDIGTRRIYNEEHDMFRKTARRFFQDEVLPNHAQ
jgi:hypothetical protein